MDWYWVLVALALALGAFYNAYEAEKKAKQLEKRVKGLEEKIK
ncbi:hypothetical protein [Salimicrobium flavidum]|uniref:Uncharacterized protein n=1 Tax=Salimicrobium flavidum TaxID=570947 RepID=A0A1N7JI19_9BACI|nr:hypothetical protein [Salimicrobium flavidum]SIS48993.1 hypothetical protein SAMN05421687_10679 [Salimicrobium flavidum]